jgi:hypothetical protein
MSARSARLGESESLMMSSARDSLDDSRVN